MKELDLYLRTKLIVNWLFDHTEEMMYLDKIPGFFEQNS